jgi:selenide,water dikinase
MLPGLLAGHYGFEDTHIDLARLCQWAGVRLLRDTVTGLDPTRRLLFCEERGEVAYDILSLDIGSQPELDSVPGAREHAVPVKPVAGLWQRWSQLSDAELSGQRIAVVGGGAGSVEVVLAMAHRLPRAQFSLYSGASELLPGYSGGARRAAEQALAKHSVALHVGQRVARVSAGELHFEGGPSAQFDTLIWCTGAAAAPWIAASRLPVDERGFMLIDDTLQSTGWPEIFGAGDIATQHRHPRPKAGVYAVRQGPVLAHNLRAFSLGQPLREHRPQRRFLSLLSLGDRSAVAERHGLSARGAWVWRWKDRIDREFMDRFRDLPDLDMPHAASGTGGEHGPSEQAPCGGCGAKVAIDTLQAVLAELRDDYPDVVAAADELDDAATLNFRGPVLQSVDALRSLVDDPWLMGAIAAQHSLSDLYACGARPHSAQAMLTLPFGAAAIQHRDLRAVLAGALRVLADAHCRLVGGHSMQGPELQIGFAVNGEVAEEPLDRHGAKEGDVLLLSAPLGTGVLFAAHMQLQADGRDVETALQRMRRGNGAAADVARQSAATALTDITGFGLAGHLRGLLGAGLSAEIDLGALPVLPGVMPLLARGLRSSLHASNERALRNEVQLAAPVPPQLEALLYDPQTCGGLLMSLPEAKAADALTMLGATGAARIGRLRRREAGAAAILASAAPNTPAP